MGSSRTALVWPALGLALGLVILAPAAARSRRQAGGAAAISTPGPIAIQVWQPGTDDRVPVTGRVTIGGTPVTGATVRVGDYELPTATGSGGTFTYLADATRLARYTVSVADASHASLGGAALTPAEQTALGAQHATITLAYPLSGLRAALNAKGEPVIAGRMTFSDRRTSPPTVSLYSYQLTGTVTDSSGKPVSGATVSTRTGDRNFWTISSLTDSRGRYSSLFTASDESGDNPVPMNVEVAIGNIVYAYLPFEFTEFPALRSARLDIRLPPAGYQMAPVAPSSYPGAVYQGIIVGVGSGGTASVVPLAATWPDASGRFTITLPRGLAGHSVTLWEAQQQLFEPQSAAPGSAIDTRSWPRAVPSLAARSVETLRLP